MNKPFSADSIITNQLIYLKLHELRYKQANPVRFITSLITEWAGKSNTRNIYNTL